MKLAFSLFKYFPYGGLSRDFMRIVEESRRRDHDITVFAAQWQGARPEGVEVCMVPTYRWRNHAQNASFYHRVRSRLKSEHFDAVIGFNKMPGLDLYYGADYCYVGRAVPRYGPWYRITPRYHHFHTFERAVFGCHSETEILSLSEREKSVYQEFYGTPDDRFHLLPPTLDKQHRLNGSRDAVRERARRDLNVKENERLLLFIGSGFKTKGLDRAIEALAVLPEELRRETRLIVVGQDNESTFGRYAQNLSAADRVQFLGGRSDIPELLAAGDLLVHPAYSENTGTVLLEAIAAGLPVLATDVCGYAAHIEAADAGIVLKSPFEQNTLNEKLLEMLTSPDREKWSRNGIAYGTDTSLYLMPENAVDTIESWVEDKENHCAVDACDHSLKLHLRDDLHKSVGEQDKFEDIMSIGGEVFREAPGRRTLRFNRDGQSYFLKTHTGVGWHEILKNLIYFRLPVIGATNEWHGIHHLERLGIDTLRIAGYGTKGRNPARRLSFIVTDELANTVSLEDFCRSWLKQKLTKDEIRFKRWLIKRVAEIARVIHSSGANHRDFYLCHFLLEINGDKPEVNNAKVFLIDLHRMQIRHRTPIRWSVKDISGLYYSSMDIGLSQRDLYRFMRIYRNKPLRDILGPEASFWRRVRSRAKTLYASEQRRAVHRTVQTARPAPSV